MIKEILMPILGLDNLGWQMFLGTTYGAIASTGIFFGTAALLYFVFGRKAIEDFRKWIDERFK